MNARWLPLALGLLLAIGSPVIAAEAEPALARPDSPAKIHSIEADFVQEKHLKILARPLVSYGSFAFQAPRSLRWEYRRPMVSILISDGDTIRRFVEHEGVLVEQPGMGFDAMELVLAEISNWLDGRFSDNPLFTTSRPEPRTIVLTPREAGLRTLISSIELQLAEQSGGQGLLERVTIVEGPDAFTTMTFSNRLLNGQIPLHRFQGP
ncbi:outer membrane lipoprotein carrier protein LolA [Desulfogranum mediterraneum]|uniref:outer membrane lipoprotein carrier protein LolA n=1 Tax=Desulfogranum mediterraneum TaxID=160661 RepID=UPI000406E01D|nr:outer membrane lipoprotein carrier protein LolA [Desulfogranum mediterraneum]